MVTTWALEGLLYHEFGAYVYTIVVLGAFGLPSRKAKNGAYSRQTRPIFAGGPGYLKLLPRMPLQVKRIKQPLTRVSKARVNRATAGLEAALEPSHENSGHPSTQRLKVVFSCQHQSKIMIW